MGRERASCSKRSAKVGLVAVRPSPAQVAILAVGWGSARAQLQVGARSRLRARVRIDCLHACLILGHRAPGVLRQDIQAAFLGHLAGGTKPGRRLRVTRSSIACARQSRLLDPPRAELLALRPRETPYRRGRRQKRGADRSRRVGFSAGAVSPGTAAPANPCSKAERFNRRSNFHCITSVERARSLPHRGTRVHGPGGQAVQTHSGAVAAPSAQPDFPGRAVRRHRPSATSRSCSTAGCVHGRRGADRGGRQRRRATERGRRALLGRKPAVGCALRGRAGSRHAGSSPGDLGDLVAALAPHPSGPRRCESRDDARPEDRECLPPR